MFGILNCCHPAGQRAGAMLIICFICFLLASYISTIYDTKIYTTTHLNIGKNFYIINNLIYNNFHLL